ncbi:MAG: hypothetical protein R6V27_06120 [Balneolaceae bacterium]
MPTFPLVAGQQLRCAISIGDEEHQWVTFEAGRVGESSWQENVLESRMTATTQLELEPGTYRFKLWGTDPSVNVDKKC